MPIVGMGLLAYQVYTGTKLTIKHMETILATIGTLIVVYGGIMIWAIKSHLKDKKRYQVQPKKLSKEVDYFLDKQYKKDFKK
jgi:hypothetical protein